jgi:hypothetical protein
LFLLYPRWRRGLANYRRSHADAACYLDCVRHVTDRQATPLPPAPAIMIVHKDRDALSLECLHMLLKILLRVRCHCFPLLL